MQTIRLWLVVTLMAWPALGHAQDANFAALIPQASAEIGWQAADTEASFVERVRHLSQPLGQECSADDAAIAALATDASAAVQGDAVAGKPLVLEWQAPNAPSSAPAWLIVSFDRPVRFAGQGFYALTPGATAPFGLETGKGETRALVALFGPDAATSGRIEVVPLQAGPLQVKVSLAGFVRKCGREQASLVSSQTVVVSSSTEAVFLVRDPFSFDAPQRTLASPDAATSTEVYDGRYRLIEAQSRAILADREGRQPSYSPTGRFLLALNGNGYDVLDTVDGSLVAQVATGTVGWENADSFLVNGEPSYGAVDLRNPLVADYRLGIGDVLLDCTVCSGFTTVLTIDLENDTALRIGGHGYALSRLSSDAVVSGEVDVVDEDIMAEMGAAVGDYFATMNAAPPHIPEHWNFRGGLKFSALSEDIEATGDAGFDGWMSRVKAAVAPVLEVKKVAELRPETLQPTGIGQGRGVTRLAKPHARGDAITTRLAEFGLDLAQPTLPSFAKTGELDTDADNLIAERIVKSVPAAANFIEPMDSYGCMPDDATEANPKIFAYFDNALEFKAGDRTLWLTLFSCKWNEGGAYEPNFFLFDSSAPEPIRLGAENPGPAHAGQCDHDIAYCGIDARLYADRYLLIWSRPSRAMMLYDIDSHQTVFRQFDLERGELLKEAGYATGDGHVVQINSDGSFYVYDTASQQRVLSGRYVDDEVVVWASDLRFDASPEGANYVNLRFPGQRGQYTFQQFSSVIRKPGLVRAVLKGDYAPAATPVSIPPTITGEIALAKDRIVGDVATQGAVEIRVYQDGLRTDVLPVSGGEASMTVDIAHATGARWVSLVAAGSDGLVSLPVGRSLAATAGVLPLVHVLSVGVDRYAADDIADLRFAAKDARTLASALDAQSGKSIQVGISANLVDEQASRAAILSEAARIVGVAKEGETVVVSFAGHGIAGPDGRFYMATSATDLSDIPGTALAWDDLAQILVKSKARVVVFLDACHSGAAGTGLFASNDDAAGGMLATVPSGLLVFSASKGRQFSEEAAASGGGVFTNAVADVIARQRATYDLDGDGVIEVSELYAGVKRRVSEITDGRQVPWLARNEMIGDFALF